jgi:uncharacterized protein YbjT (DUF2867 family)
MAYATKRAAIQHVIWSTLEDTRKWVPLIDMRMPTLKGEYKVPHFDAKGEADKVFTGLGRPVTFLLTSFFWDNFIYRRMAPKKGRDGKLALTLPMDGKKLPGIAVEDVGRSAYGIFKRGHELAGKTVGVAGEHLTGAQMAAAFSTALGQEVVYNAVPHAVYRNFGFPGADDMGNMFQFKCDFNEYFCAARNPETARDLVPSVQSFEDWLAQNKARIPLS